MWGLRSGPYSPSPPHSHVTTLASLTPRSRSAAGLSPTCYPQLLPSGFGLLGPRLAPLRRTAARPVHTCPRPDHTCPRLLLLHISPIAFVRFRSLRPSRGASQAHCLFSPALAPSLTPILACFYACSFLPAGFGLFGTPAWGLRYGSNLPLPKVDNVRPLCMDFYKQGFCNRRGPHNQGCDSAFLCSFCFHFTPCFFSLAI
jgi:hypothetical protein